MSTSWEEYRSIKPRKPDRRLNLELITLGPSGIHNEDREDYESGKAIIVPIVLKIVDDLPPDDDISGGHLVLADKNNNFILGMYHRYSYGNDVIGKRIQNLHSHVIISYFDYPAIHKLEFRLHDLDFTEKDVTSWLSDYDPVNDKKLLPYLYYSYYKYGLYSGICYNPESWEVSRRRAKNKDKIHVLLIVEKFFENYQGFSYLWLRDCRGKHIIGIYKDILEIDLKNKMIDIQSYYIFTVNDRGKYLKTELYIDKFEIVHEK